MAKVKPTPKGFEFDVPNARYAVNQMRANIEVIQKAVHTLREAGLQHKTVLILMSHHTGLPQKTINRVLQGLETLVESYFEVEDSDDG